MRVGTWNVHGLSSKELEVASICSRLKLDFVAIQETFWKRQNPPFLPGYKWFGRQNSQMPGRRGVGLLVKDEWHSRCSVVYPMPKQEDILVVRFQRHRNVPIFVVCLYIPTNDEPKPCRQAAFSELLELTRSMELQGHVVILGDAMGIWSLRHPRHLGVPTQMGSCWPSSLWMQG